MVKSSLAAIDNRLELVMDEEVFIVGIVFFSFATVFSLWFYFRFRGRMERQQTIRLAIEREGWRGCAR